MITGVTQSGAEEVEEVHKAVKCYYLLSYMLKPPSLLTQGFKKNKNSQEKIFKHMRGFGARAEWRNGRRAASYYLDVETRNHQYCLVNPTPLDCTKDYIMGGAIGDRALERLPQKRLNLINGSISSY